MIRVLDSIQKTGSGRFYVKIQIEKNQRRREKFTIISGYNEIASDIFLFTIAIYSFSGLFHLAFFMDSRRYIFSDDRNQCH